jgi:D-3-phosphoglycerate dehydrogenase
VNLFYGNILTGNMNLPAYNLRLLNTEPNRYNPSALSDLQSLLYVDNIEADRRFLLEFIHNYDVILIALRNLIDKEVLLSASNLKCIVTPTTGLNHIDIECAQRLGVEVLSLKGELEFLKTITATAELTWGLLLTLVRRINLAHLSVMTGSWSRDSFYGNELNGMTLGIVGYGRLGRKLAQYAHAFGMKTLAFDKECIETQNVKQVSLHALAAQSDVISVHLSLNDSTYKLLDSYFFSNVKKGSIFINTSRGDILDEDALLTALLNRSLSGAALDVLASETSTQPSWLMESPLYRYAREFDNLILTPHIGGVTHQSVERTNDYMIRKLALYLHERCGC